MSPARRTQLVTVAVLVLLGGLLALRQTGWRPLGRGAPRGATPEDAVYAMFEAARRGDLETYLECLRGPARTAIEQAVAETGRQAFARYLRERHQPIKGIAITAPERLSEDEVAARVEYVFENRNEVQQLRLERVEGAWRVTQWAAAETRKPRIPYGAPVE